MTLVEKNDVDQSISVSKNDQGGFQYQDQNKKVVVANGNGALNHHDHDDGGADDGVVVGGGGDHVKEGFKKEMRDLAEMLSKLNPMAEEFVPPSLSNNVYNNGSVNGLSPILMPPPPAGAPFGYSVVNDFLMQTNQTPFANMNGVSPRRVFYSLLFCLVCVNVKMCAFWCLLFCVCDVCG